MIGQIDIALYALGITSVFQIFCIVIGVIARRSMPAMPILEILFRPFFVGLIDRLNRRERSDFALIIRGAITFFIIFGVFCGLAYGVTTGMTLLGYPQWIHIVLLFLVLSPLMVIKTAYDASVEKPKDGAYLQLSHVLNQNLIPADNHGLRRAGCKAMALSLCDYVIAPLLFYVLGGIIGAYLYVALSLFVRLSGGQNKSFTSIFALIYSAMRLAASLVGMILVGLSSIFSAGGKPLNIFKPLKHPSVMVESAFSYAQNITLGGTYQDRQGSTVKSKWVGPEKATAKLDHRDILRVIIHYAITIFLIMAMLYALVIY